MSLLTELILKLIRIYGREPDAAYRALDDPMWVLTGDLSDEAAAKIESSAAKRNRKSLEQRTLMSLSTSKVIAESANEFGLTNEEMLDSIPYWIDREQHRMDGERELSDATVFMRSDKPAVSLLTYFVERLDHMDATLDLLTKEEDLRKIKTESQGVAALLHEAHVNYLIGLNASSVILFWAAIETALKEKLEPFERDTTTIFALLTEAENRNLLDNPTRVLANEVYDLRNAAAHNDKEFQRHEAEFVKDSCLKARKVVSELYKLSEAPKSG